MPDYKLFDDICADAYKDGKVTKTEFVQAMLALFVSKDGYVIDTGSLEQVLAEVLLRLQPKVHRLKCLWKKFMVA